MNIIEILKEEPPAGSEIRLVDGIPKFFLNGKKTYPFFALSVGMYETIEGYTKSGIDFFAPIIGLDIGWQGPGKYDWSFLDNFFYRLLELNENACFLPRITLTAPLWWKDSHKEECICYGLSAPEKRFRRQESVGEGGLNWNAGSDMYDVSFASEIWKRDTEKTLKDFINHMENSPLVSRMMGYQVTSGMTGEWHYPGSEYLPDYSGPMREFCGEVPDPQSRIGSTLGLLRDPEQESQVMHFYREYHRNTAETIIRFAKCVKEVTDNRVLCGTFYCYITENVYIQECGHLSPMTVLRSPCIDYVACPYTYLSTNIPDKEKWETDVTDGAGNLIGRGRGAGGDGGYRIPLESVKRHGKLFIAELDPTTYLEPVKATEGGSGHQTPQGTLDLLARDMAKVFALGIGGWFYDFGHLKQRFKANRGWYDDEPMHDLIRKYVSLGKKRENRKNGGNEGKSFAEIAVVYSAESFTATRHWKDSGCRFTRSQDFFNYWFLDVQSRGICRIGAPADEYFLEDFIKLHDKSYKFVLFPNAFLLSSEQIAELKCQLAGSGGTALWYYAPGILSRKDFSFERMEELTGIRFSRSLEEGSFLIDTNFADNIGKFGAPEKMRPRLRVTDEDAEVLGNWSDGGGTAFAKKETNGFTSIYSGTAPVPPGILRKLSESAGVAMVSSRQDAVFGTDASVCVIAAESGERKVSLPVPMRDAFDEEDEVKDKHKINLRLGEVKLYVT
jgi:hypothetical protein